AEALPQVLGVRHGSSLSLLLVRPVQGLIFLLAPLTKFAEVLFRSLHHQEALPYLERASWRTEDILRLASGTPQTISRSISRFISAKHQPISALLRPAAQTVFISETDTLQSVIQKFSTSGFSRLPYWKSGPARFFAYLHIKDVLAMLAHNELDWKRFLHPLPVFTPNTSILKAFTSLRSLGAHIAAVVTPDGRIAGIVTMDDLLHFFIGPYHPVPVEPEVTHLSSPAVPRKPG
ncbi:MAG: CBS domain-containing protein, partial [bacterium JZ-2024 1]